MYVAGFIGFTQLLRYSQLRGASMLYVIAVNYLVAAACTIFLLLRRGEYVADPLLLILAAITGVFFFVHLLVMLASYNHAGVGITQAVSTSGYVAPILMAWLLWPDKEAMTAVRWAGVALMPVSIFLMRPNTGEKLRFSLRDELILLMPFAFSGLIGCIHKLVTTRYGDAGQATYQAVLFTFAMLSSWAHVLWHRRRGKRVDFALGALVGFVNVFALLTMMLALSGLAASVFFPISTSAGIALTLFVSWLLWREKITRQQAIGIALAIVVVILTRQ